MFDQLGIDKLRSELRKVEDRIDEFGIRERALIFISVMLVLYMAATNLVFAPLFNEQDRLEKEINVKREAVNQLNVQIADLTSVSSKDPDADNKAKLAMLKEEFRRQNAALSEMTAGLVSPREMANLVEEILVKNRRLKLVQVKSLPPKPLLESDTGQKTTKATASSAKTEGILYKRGMEIILEGRYLDILQYLETLEGLSWKVFWGQASLKVDEYPTSRFSLVIYTLTLDKSWIGV